MNISGSGSIIAGEYSEKINISGSGRLKGNVRCVSLVGSGSVKGDGSLTCSENVRISGSGHIAQDISANDIRASGSLKVGGDINAREEVRASGSLSCGGSIKCGKLSCAGSVSADGEIAAEEIRASGVIKCKGLINAEKIDIDMSGASFAGSAGSIGGSEIKIYNSNGGRAISRMPILKHLVGGSGSFNVDELIEGDVIALEYTSAPKVVGRVVAIGAGCDIQLVQYSEEIEIHPSAKVGKCEKI